MYIECGSVRIIRVASHRGYRKEGYLWEPGLHGEWKRIVESAWSQLPEPKLNGSSRPTHLAELCPQQGKSHFIASTLQDSVCYDASERLGLIVFGPLLSGHSDVARCGSRAAVEPVIRYLWVICAQPAKCQAYNITARTGESPPMAVK